MKRCSDYSREIWPLIEASAKQPRQISLLKSIQTRKIQRHSRQWPFQTGNNPSSNCLTESELKDSVQGHALHSKVMSENQQKRIREVVSAKRDDSAKRCKTAEEFAKRSSAENKAIIECLIDQLKSTLVGNASRDGDVKLTRVSHGGHVRMRTQRCRIGLKFVQPDEKKSILKATPARTDQSVHSRLKQVIHRIYSGLGNNWEKTRCNLANSVIRQGLRFILQQNRCYLALQIFKTFFQSFDSIFSKSFRNISHVLKPFIKIIHEFPLEPLIEYVFVKVQQVYDTGTISVAFELQKTIGKEFRIGRSHKYLRRRRTLNLLTIPLKYSAALRSHVVNCYQKSLKKNELEILSKMFHLFAKNQIRGQQALLEEITSKWEVSLKSSTRFKIQLQPAEKDSFEVEEMVELEVELPEGSGIEKILSVFPKVRRSTKGAEQLVLGKRSAFDETSTRRPEALSNFEGLIVYPENNELHEREFITKQRFEKRGQDLLAKRNDNSCGKAVATKREERAGRTERTEVTFAKSQRDQVKTFSKNQCIIN